ncbi:DeoR/GlpR family DNA-binding transcription regulator [Rhizobium sp. CNPSo 3464]|uniref:DeoR/GlpR family DNA-binding transcription regulator n=1 Tax=Rhizobium sp. CNPSo 3464 TaxID=3021406 RepID=UPI00254BB9A9|nr:DeoR/GlpR family DNA-binding transcription regulator [Rhizobium sp. CNPSo 3464]MDK4739902.1 DeoR/GlpR family DNA-binding transcription regulator [Rhizobium sp. CNPSo 3464]
MKREERQQLIVNLLVEHKSVDLDDLADRFAVSKMTIHRDLDDLEQSGVLRKIRGGATIDAGMQFESDFRIRERQGHEAKVSMARRALELVEPGMTVMVNDGSMAAVLGEMLLQKRPLTLITNNAAIIERLKNESGITLIALGGIYSPKFNAFLGVVTEEALFRLRADIAFISTPAVSGTLAYHMDDNVVRAKRAMIASASKTCLLVNHQRIGHTALHVMADLADFDTIITDDTPEPAALKQLERANITLTIALNWETT